MTLSKTQSHNDPSVLNHDLFKPAPVNGKGSESISRPVVGYWKDAFLRLMRNKIAVTSLVVISVVGIVGVVGPWMFPATEGGNFENLQNPDSRNQGVSLGEKVLVTDDFQEMAEDLVDPAFKASSPLLTAEALPAVANFRILGNPTVNGITITWDPMPTAAGYKVFRALSPTESDLNVLANDADKRGFEVSSIADPAKHSFTDAAGLDPSDAYAYTVIPYALSADGTTEELGLHGVAVKAILQKTVPLSKAQSIDPDVKVGDSILSRPHFFGTDGLGRDILARMIFGTRVDFFLALLVPTLAMLFGLIYGALSGLLGGKTDTFMMRIIEIIDSLPDLLLFVLLQVALGKGVVSLVIALSAFSWTNYARILRGEVLRLREIEFVHASRLLGASMPKLIFRHIAPNLLGVIIVLWSGHIPRIITAEAFLSLIGLGVESPMATWGTVLQEAGERFQIAPLQFFLPASVMAVTLLAFFLLGDALRDAFDPKLRGRE
jgi:oligopeptide transport system permease protein